MLRQYMGDWLIFNDPFLYIFLNVGKYDILFNALQTEHLNNDLLHIQNVGGGKIVSSEIRLSMCQI